MEREWRILEMFIFDGGVGVVVIVGGVYMVYGYGGVMIEE